MNKLLKKYLSGGSILIVSLFLVNIINFIFNAYLGRVLSFEAYGLVALVTTLWYVLTIFLTALYVTVNHRTAFLIAQNGTAAGSNFLSITIKKVLLLTLGLSIFWILAIPWIDAFFQIDDFLIPLLFTPMITLGALVAAQKGFLQGNLDFRSVAIIIILEAISKLFFAWIFVTSNLAHWAYVSIPLSVVLSFLLAYLFTTGGTKHATSNTAYAFPKRFFLAVLITGFSSMAFLTFDVLLAKHYLTPVAAGQYALLALIGKMVYFLGALPSALIITYVSRDEGANRNPRIAFYKLFVATILLSLGGFLALGVLGDIFVPFLLGEKTTVILPYLTKYASAIALFAISGSLISYHLAKQQYLFPLIAIMMAVVMSVSIIFYHKDISQITSVIFTVSFLSFFTITVLHLLELVSSPKMSFLRKQESIQ